MIKINLLPHKKIKQVDKAVMKLRAMVIGFIVLVALVVGYGTVHMYLEKSALTKKAADTKQKLDVLKKKAAAFFLSTSNFCLVSAAFFVKADFSRYMCTVP